MQYTRAYVLDYVSSEYATKHLQLLGFCTAERTQVTTKVFQVFGEVK